MDDFKLSGPKQNLKEGWRLCMQGLEIEPPRLIDAEGATYLGCRQRKQTLTLKSGEVVSYMEYDMQDFIVSAVEKYNALVKDCPRGTTTTDGTRTFKLLPLKDFP